MIGASLERGLRDDGYAVDWVHDGVSAAAALRDTQAAIVEQLARVAETQNAIANKLGAGST